MTEQHQPQITPPVTSSLEGAMQWQRQTDLQHLKLLSIFYYIFAGLQALGGCGGLFYILMGVFVTAAPQGRQQSNAMSPQALATMFVIMGGCLVLLCAVWAGLSVYTAISLNRQQNRTFCQIVAGITCLSIPLGTILGIFTFLVLNRPSVIALFNKRLIERTALNL